MCLLFGASNHSGSDSRPRAGICHGFHLAWNRRPDWNWLCRYACLSDHCHGRTSISRQGAWLHVLVLALRPGHHSVHGHDAGLPKVSSRPSILLYGPAIVCSAMLQPTTCNAHQYAEPEQILFKIAFCVSKRSPDATGPLRPAGSWKLWARREGRSVLHLESPWSSFRSLFSSLPSSVYLYYTARNSCFGARTRSVGGMVTSLRRLPEWMCKLTLGMAKIVGGGSLCHQPAKMSLPDQAHCHL